MSQSCRAHLFSRAHLILQKSDFEFFFVFFFSIFLKKTKKKPENMDQHYLTSCSIHGALSKILHACQLVANTWMWAPK